MSADQPEARIAINAEMIELLRAKELENVLQKLNSGLTLTIRDWEIIHAHREDTKPAESAPVTRPATTPAEIAAFYGTSVITIERCDRIGALPDVKTPPPWSDPPALASWYRENYRSDPSKPPTKRDKLPKWLVEAQQRPAPAFSGPEPVSGGAVSQTAPVGNPEASALSSDDIVGVARTIVAAKKAKVEKSPDDPAAQRDYLEAVEKLQAIESRAKKAGTSDDVPKARVCEVLDTLLRRVPRNLQIDLTAAYPDARRALAATDPEAAWTQFAEHFVKTALNRLISTGFADRLNQHLATVAET